MMETDPRRGAVDPGAILMVLAFLVIGGFLYWLNGQAAEERAQTEVMEEDTTTVVETTGATDVAAADIMTDASAYEGQEVRVEPLAVAGLLGEQGFFLDMPAGPFLVSMSDEIRAEGLQLSVGGAVRVTGTVRAMNDSIAAAWLEAGRISEADQTVAAFSVHYIEADRVEVPSGAASGSDQGGGGA